MSTEKKIIILSTLATILILIGGVFWLGSSSAPEIKGSQYAKAMASVTNGDYGRIPMNNGNVTKEFTIKNTGTDFLKLFNIKTSCHCTKAYVSIENNQSPSFGMDTYSSWVGEVLPGKEAKLNVVFDPAYHGPAGVGPISRYVSVETNDQSNSKLTFTVVGTVFK